MQLTVSDLSEINALPVMNTATNSLPIHVPIAIGAVATFVLVGVLVRVLATRQFTRQQRALAAAALAVLGMALASAG